MPNYNFKCLDCQKNFEIRATIKEMEEGKISCKNCKSKNVKRIFDGFGICASGGSCPTCSSGNCSICGS
ncbi:MAG: FmdB family zinc ribbon protein [Candidatus Caldatribacteriota bacterium]|nr:FmdB family zinc ribbon protein [Candidatus Caldatribacteriota bacterium]